MNKQLLAFVLAAAPVMAQAPGPLMSSILPRYETVKVNLIDAAEAMPAEHYEFRLTPPQRTFGEWIDHNTKMNYNMCSQAAGEPAPRPGRFAGTSPKPELVEALKASFAYCDNVFQHMTDQKALSQTTTGPKPGYPVNVMIGLLVNWNSHYGNLVGYLRTKGLTPPSTSRSLRNK